MERADARSAESLYYGISASRASEPIDQFDVLLLVSRLRRSGLGAGLTVFVAGRYAELNGMPGPELVRQEERKLGFLRASSSALGIPMEILRTDDLWRDPAYWAAVSGLASVPGIIGARGGRPFSEVAPSLGEAVLSAMPAGLTARLGGFPAPSLYTLFEVAEAAYLMRERGIECKVGPASEEEYDRFICSFMGIMQLCQPIDFRSRQASPRPLTPYIGKAGETRITIDDGKAEMAAKICSLAQRCEGRPVRYGGFMDPFARLAVLALESAAAADSVPVRLNGRPLYDGEGAVGMLERSGMSGLTRFAPLVAECIWAYLVRPVQLRLREAAS